MDPLTFARSQNEESDVAAERRWENEGGNPGSLSALRSRSSDMPKQKRKHDFGGSRSIPKRDTPRSKSASPKQRKQLAHNAPVRRAAGKFRE
jgi:hypothetical protein